MQKPDEPTTPLLPIQPPPGAPQTLRQLLRRGHSTRLNSAREIMQEVNISYPTLRRSEENPALLTLGDVYRLAEMMNIKVEVLLAHLVHEIKELPDELQPLATVVRTGVGRPRHVRRQAEAGEADSPVKAEKKKGEKKK